MNETETADTRWPWDIADDGLCVRCGACFDICPLNLITPDSDFYPRITAENQAQCTQCGLCMEPCPANVDFPALYSKLFDRTVEPLDAVGHILDVAVGYSCDAGVRSQASSGGVATALLTYMLQKGLIERALVCRMDEQKPWQAVPVLAETQDELIEASQSKYTIVPQMRLLGEIARSDRPTAVVGLPCHIHAFRKFQAARPESTRNVVFALGITCNSTLEIDATHKLMEVCGIALEDVARFEYRGGDWPGGIRVTLKSGKICTPHSEDIKATFNYLTSFYCPQRCLTCIDYSAEMSDMSVMDPWIRDESGNHPYLGGYSLMLVRTPSAKSILEGAVKDGALHIEKLPREILGTQFDPIVRYKKVGAAIRIANRRGRGKAVPDYNLTFPPAPTGNRIGEKLSLLKRLPGACAWGRDLAVRIAFSRFGDQIMRLRTKQKIRRSSARHARG